MNINKPTLTQKNPRRPRISIDSTNPGQLLTDTALMAFFNTLEEPHITGIISPHILSYPELGEGITMSNYHRILAPWHQPGNHWILLHINLRNNSVEVIDPLRQCIPNRTMDRLATLMPYIRRWMGISHDPITKEADPHSLQDNSVDCGAFVAIYAKNITKGTSLDNVSQTDIQEVRSTMRHLLEGSPNQQQTPTNRGERDCG